MVEGNGLRTCRINLPFLKLVKMICLEMLMLGGGGERMSFFFFFWWHLSFLENLTLDRKQW